MKLLTILKGTETEYYEIVKDILESEEFIKRKSFKHHGDETVYEHCLKVSIISYKISKAMGVNYKSAAIGGLLHDFYYEPWQEKHEKTAFFKQHGFVHAREALNNSKKNYGNIINKRVENIILRHMFPLNIIPPRYVESWVITSVDKYVSLSIFKEPTNLYKYLGIKGEKIHE